MQLIKINPTYTETTVDEEWKKYRTKEYWDYRKQWIENPKNKIVGNFPIHLDLETTSYCNLECVMCPRTILMNRGLDYLKGEDKEISWELYKKIIDESSKEGLKSIKFQYLGEPLADSLIIKRIKYAKSKGIIDTMFNTNATLLDRGTSQEVLKSGIDNVFFSVDSIIPEKYEKIRVNANYDEVVENIKTFMILKKAIYPHINTRISMVVLPGTTQKELNDFKDFWLPIVGTVGFDKWINHANLKEHKTNAGFICVQPFQRLLIKYDGTVSPCCNDALKEFPVGNVNYQTIKEIWKGNKIQQLRNAHVKGNYKDIDICKKCIVPCM